MMMIIYDRGESIKSTAVPYLYSTAKENRNICAKRREMADSTNSEHDITGNSEMESDSWGMDTTDGNSNLTENFTTTDALGSIGDKILRRKKSNGSKLKEKSHNFKIPTYQMDYPSTPDRGYAVIINIENFHWTTGMNRRTGTDADSVNLSRLFNKLDFKVEIHKDATSTAIMEITKTLAGADHSQYDCFMMVFLSHGDDGVIYSTNGTVKIRTIVDMFRGSTCPSLAGKPKMFIFQACRGSKHEDPVESMGDTVDGLLSIENEVVVDAAVRPTIPSGSDFLFCYSVAEGFYSHRDTLYGSWFVQAFVEVFEEELLNKGRASAAQMGVLDLLTLVNYKVANRKVERTKNPLALGKKQMPCFLSMLTKKLYLAPKQ